MSAATKTDALVAGDNATRARHSLRNHDLLVDGLKILVMRLRQIGCGGHQTKWVNGNVGSFPNGRFDRPSGDYKSDCEYRESDAEQGAHVRSPLALRKSANALELSSH